MRDALHTTLTASNVAVGARELLKIEKTTALEPSTATLESDGTAFFFVEFLQHDPHQLMTIVRK